MSSQAGSGPGGGSGDGRHHVRSLLMRELEYAGGEHDVEALRWLLLASDWGSARMGMASLPGGPGLFSVCAVPAAGYWVTRKAWMPELTRFVWLAWIVVGFALTYGNYLSSLARA